MPLTLLIAALIAIFACGSSMTAAQAADLSGSASVWAYARDDTADHVQVVPTLSLKLREFAGDAWRIETSLRGFADFRNGESHDEQLRVLRGVLVFAPTQSPWEFRVGQQWLTEGVGRGNVAGGWAKWRANKKSSVTAYGGWRIANSLSLNEKNEDNGYVAGVHARTSAGIAKFGGSYYFLGKSGHMLFHAAGLEADVKPVASVLARGRFDVNLGQGSVERAQLLADWNPNKDLLLTGEFRIHQPRIYEGSYFERFLEEATTTYLRGGAAYMIGDAWYAKVNGVTLFTENPDPLYKVRGAVGMNELEVGYTRWMTVSGGEMDGWYAQLRGDVDINKKHVGELFGGFDFARGSNADVNLRSESESQSMYLGVLIEPVKSFNFSATAEQVRDLDSRKEWRGLFSIGYRFGEYRREMR